MKKIFFVLGWKITLLARTDFMPIPTAMNKKQQDLQMHVGTVFKRYHIRLWDIHTCTIAGVHMDRLRFIGHTATDFESIEKDVANLFKNLTNWRVRDDAEDMQNQLSGYGQPYNNGKATVIEK